MSDLPGRPHSDFDPLAPETFDSPYVEYAELRAKCPVAHSDAWNGFWAFLTYDDVRQAATDSDTFITSVQNVVPKVAFTGRRPPLHLDPPEHTPYRAALNPLFGQARMEALEPAIRRFTVGLLEPLLARGEGQKILDPKLWVNRPQEVEKLGEGFKALRAGNMVDAAAMKSQVKQQSLRDKAESGRWSLQPKKKP